MSFLLDLFHDPAGEFGLVHLEDHLPDVGGAWIKDSFTGPYIGFNGTDAVTIAFGGDSVYYNDLSLATADYEFEIDVQSTGSGALSDDIYVAIRHQVATRDRYQVKYKFADSTVWLQKVIFDTAVDLDGPFHLADWDPPLGIVVHNLKIKAVGNTITGYVDGTPRFTYVDTSSPITGPGTVGIGGFRTVGEPLYIIHANAVGTAAVAVRTGLEIGGRKVGRNLIRTMEWVDERYGGMWDFTLTVNRKLSEPIPFQEGDLVEFWWKGERRYRGKFYGRDKHQDDPQSSVVTGYGCGYRAFKGILSHPIVYGQPTDAARMFSDIVSEAVLPIAANLKIDAQTTGVLVQRIEAQYRAVKEVLDELAQTLGENRLLYGGDWDIFGFDQVFIRPFSTKVDWTLKVPGPRVGNGGSKTELGDIVNVLTILGGQPLYPNLIYNSSFERPRQGGDGEGNLVSHPGFEPEGVETQSSSGGPNVPWHGSGTYKQSGNAEGSPYAGSWMFETDNNGENIYQTQNPPATAIVPGRDYVVSCRSKIEVEATACIGQLRLEWLDTGGGTLQTDDLPLPVYSSGLVPSLSATWQQFMRTSRAPAGATGFKITGSIESGGSVGHGILWDEIEVYDSTLVFQDKWEVARFGTATVDSINWAFLNAYEGGYSVYISATSSDDDANQVTLQSIGRQRFDVQGGAQYDLSCFVKNAPDGASTPKLRLVILEYDKGGKLFGSPTTADLAAGSHPDWTQFHATRTFQQTSTYAVAYLAVRGSGSFLADAFCFRDHAAGLVYVRDGDSNAYVRTIRCDDSTLLSTDPVISDAAADSINQYDIWPGVETVDLVVTDDDAFAYAAAYFNTHSVPFPLPEIELTNDDRFFRPGQMVRPLGPDGLALFDGPSGQEAMLPVARVRWSYDGMLHATLELQKEVPDIAEQLLKKLQKRIGAKDISTASSSISGGQPPSPPVTTSLTVREEDLSPTVTGVDTMEFPDDWVEDLGGGVAKIVPTGLMPVGCLWAFPVYNGSAWVAATFVFDSSGNMVSDSMGFPVMVRC